MADLEGKRVVVTGGAGFIGSHLCDSILQRDIDELIAVDNLFLGKESNLKHANKDSRFSFENIDVAVFKDISKVINENDIDVIFHLAVIPLEVSIGSPIWCFDQNVKMTQNILEIIRHSDRNICLIAYSSSEVYGSAVYTPMDERHPLESHTPYAASKAASDQLVYSYYKTFGLDMVIVRPFNNFGPRQNEGSYAGIIPITIKRILNGDNPIIFDDGEQTRDFIYVDDTANWTVEVYNNESTRGKILNLASGRQTSVNTVINSICREFNYTGVIDRKLRRPGDVRVHEGDVKLAKKLIGFSPETSFSQGIKHTCDWYKEFFGKMVN